MSQYIINEVELEIDMDDYEFQEKYEDAFDKMETEEKEVQKIGKKSQITLAYCKMFYHLFDNIFGEGTGEKLFKGKYNIRLINETYDEFIQICAAQAKESSARLNATVNRYKPKNRSQRRQK